jgi:hypothetical protein
MYKAIDLPTGEEIIILNASWAGRIGQLRAMDSQDRLVCQGCLQPVRVRAGRRRRAHFAHKHLQGCSYGTESPEILEGCAVLYGWLASRFPDGVTLEKKLEGVSLPRPVDGWVETETGSLAYWIIYARLRLPARERIKAALARQATSVNWVLLYNLLQPDPHWNGCIRLSPAERDFRVESQFDKIGAEKRYPSNDFGQTLHYLDAGSGRLISYRSLKLVHRPNIFSGRREEHPLAEVLAHPGTGEFIHPGEEQQLQRSLGKLTRRQQEAEQAKTRYEQWLRKSTPLIAPEPVEKPTIRRDPWEEPQGYACIFCGEVTANWWTTFVEDGVRKCKCRDCRDKGLW